VSGDAQRSESQIASAVIPPADLFLLGSGIFSFFDVTLYTQKILAACKTVYHLHDLPTLERYLAEITPNPVNLMPVYYVDGRKRDDIYEDIVRHVIDGAEKEQPVALLMHGHPLVYSTISQRILEVCGERGLRVDVVPALSSLDRIFVDLGLDIASRGLQILHASAVVPERLPLNPHVDCIFFQIASIMNPLATRGRSSLPEEVTPFKDYLLDFYPPEHVVHVVESAVELGFETRITPSQLGRLEDIAPAMTYTSSLFVQALPPPP